MGNWHISVQGIGSHHNRANFDDADRMFARFVADLKRAGHTVTDASFTYGGREDFDQVTSRVAATATEADQRASQNPVLDSNGNPMPRRCNQDRHTDLEGRIRSIHNEIEHMDADESLTRAGICLGHAFDHVADYAEAKGIVPAT